MDAFVGFCFVCKTCFSSYSSENVFVAYGVWADCIFDFAEVYDVVVSVDDEVNLHSFFCRSRGCIPGEYSADYSCNSQTVFYLWNMQQTDSFKCKTAPIVVFGGSLDIFECKYTKKMAIRCCKCFFFVVAAADMVFGGAEGGLLGFSVSCDL